jgi:hypothetical protein
MVLNNLSKTVIQNKNGIVSINYDEISSFELMSTKSALFCALGILNLFVIYHVKWILQFGHLK